MYSTEDLDALTLEQVESIYDNEQRALASAVQMHELYLTARAATRVTTRFLSDYLDERRASAADESVVELPSPDVDLETDLQSDDDLPFDESEMDEAEEAAAEE